MLKNKLAGLAALFLASSALMGADSTTDGLEAINDITAVASTTVTGIVGLALTVLGWILVVGIPASAYYFGLKHFKEKDEQDRSGAASSTMSHAKAAMVSLVGAVAGAMLFSLIFIKLMHLDETIGGSMVSDGAVMAKVLRIDEVFK